MYLDRTKSSFIDGKAGKLLYRGYNIDDLASFSSFEETCYLLIFGKLPNQNQLRYFESQMRENRPIPEPVTEIIGMVKDAHPMDVLRTAISAPMDPEWSLGISSTWLCIPQAPWCG